MTVTPLVPDALVHIAGVSFGYDRSPVLTDVNLTVRARDLVGVVGPSGSGKTSLLRLLLGTVSPHRGSVTIRPGIAIAYVPQLETVN